MVQGLAEADAFGSLTGAVATKLEADPPQRRCRAFRDIGFRV